MAHCSIHKFNWLDGVTFFRFTSIYNLKNKMGFWGVCDISTNVFIVYSSPLMNLFIILSHAYSRLLYIVMPYKNSQHARFYKKTTRLRLCTQSLLALVKKHMQYRSHRGISPERQETHQKKPGIQTINFQKIHIIASTKQLNCIINSTFLIKCHTRNYLISRLVFLLLFFLKPQKSSFFSICSLTLMFFIIIKQYPFRAENVVCDVQNCTGDQTAGDVHWT